MKLGAKKHGIPSFPIDGYIMPVLLYLHKVNIIGLFMGNVHLELKCTGVCCN